MYVKRNEHGQVMWYYQSVGADTEDVRFNPDEIVELQNNPWCDITMYGNLLEKEYQVRKKIKELNQNKDD